jgi:hypothetical protein
MSARWLRLLWLVVGVMLPGAVRAEIAPDLYAVSVPVAGQTAADLQRAAALGLREVAVRISGRSEAENSAALNAAAATADRYLAQYRYERNSADTAAATPWLAQLRFNPASVNELLRGAGLIGGAANILLRVSGIASFDDYAALLNYLGRLVAIKAASPIQLAGDEVTLQLKIQGGAEQLTRQLAQDTRLAPQASTDVVTPNVLHYRWAAPHG